MPVHGLVVAARHHELRGMFNGLSVLAPDGHPVRWALNAFHGVELPDRVYGPEFMKQLCRDASGEGVGVYLYGGSPNTVAALARRLDEAYPTLQISGSESPPYRELTAEEDAAVVDRINGSGAGIVFIGLGCPKQEVFAYRHREAIRGVQVCVGAAFDFLAGEKRMAPRWMQDRGLEWAFRLSSEPRRLWRRYLITNTAFMLLVTREMFRRAIRRDVRRKSVRR